MASSRFSSSRTEDVQFALQRAKKKISSLQQQLSHKSERSEIQELDLYQSDLHQLETSSGTTLVTES